MEKKEFNLREALTKQGAELDEKQVGFVTAFEKALNERLKNENEEYSKSMDEALKKSLGEMPEGEDGKVETISDQIRTIAENLDKIEKRQVKNLGEKEKYQLRKMVEDNHDKIIESVRNKTPFEFNFRVAATMTNGNTMTDAGTFIMPDTENFVVDSEITKIRYPKNFILNIISNARVAKVPETRIRKEQEPVEGAVAIVAEGGTKPLLQYQFVRTTTERNKYAGRIEWTEEFEMDNEALTREIIRLFEEDVVRAWNDGILDDMITNATAYTTSTLDGTLVQPDNGSAVIAAQSVIQQQNFEPDVVFMNPGDVVANMFTQNADGDWQLKPYMVGDRLNGMRLIASNKITQGDALVGTSITYREEHSDYIFRVGQYNDQFISNEYTAIGEVFSILSISQLNIPSWMYIDLDAVKASLTQI